MKRYHVCFTSHSEVLFRNPEDVYMFINLLALVSYMTGTKICLDTEMSNHVHMCVLSNNPSRFIRILRIRYTKYFNNRYLRKGPLGDEGFFLLELEGRNHICTAYSYVLRNGLHHGVSSSPFSYPYSSINCLFVKDLGKTPGIPYITSRSEIASLLPRRTKFPDSFVMDKNRMFLRESFELIHDPENFYVTPRSFLYYMNRLSGEEWRHEQEKDDTHSLPITLDTIEENVPDVNIESMLKGEKGYLYKGAAATDFDICRIIDSQSLKKYRRTSIYQLDTAQKQSIAKFLLYEIHATRAQVARCLAITR